MIALNDEYKKRYGHTKNHVTIDKLGEILKNTQNNAKYNNLRKKQDYSCAVCYEKETPEKQLHVDHSHVTNEVRGLLCQKCNTSLGMMLDSPILIGRLMGYVKTHDDYALKTVKYLKTSIGVSNKVKQIRNEKKIKIDRNTIKLTNDFFTDFIKECKKVLKSKEPKGTLEDFI